MTATRNSRRRLQGVVTSTRAAKTITVQVERTYKHPRYGKYLRRKKKYMVDDQADRATDGDLVEIAATRPLSKRKRWYLVKVLSRSDLAAGEATRAEEELKDAAGGGQ